MTRGAFDCETGRSGGLKPSCPEAQSLRPSLHFEISIVVGVAAGAIIMSALRAYWTPKVCVRPDWPSNDMYYWSESNAWYPRLAAAIADASRGLVDADLGGGVVKQRIARQGEGKSGGFGMIILFRVRERAFSSTALPRTNRTTSGMMNSRLSSCSPPT